MITSTGIIIRVPVDEISRFNRPSKGVRVMRVKSEIGEKILSIATATHDNDEVTDHPEAAELDAGDTGADEPDEPDDGNAPAEE